MLGLDILHPILQAPMAGVSTPEMAAAVCNAGALGGVAVGHLGSEAAREAIEATRRLTDRPFNVNLFCHRPAPTAVYCSFGVSGRSHFLTNRPGAFTFFYVPIPVN